MNLEIDSGNAAADGAPFQFWFIGDLERWAANKAVGSVKQNPALRQSEVVEMKWGMHRAGESRADWGPCSDKRTMSLLVRGRFLLLFRAPDKPMQITERCLEQEGDYAVWGSSVEHTWVVEEDAVIFTVRWCERL